MNKKTTFASAAAAALLLSCASAGAQGLTKIKVIGFGGASNLPMWTAMDRGLFAKNGLEVDLSYTRGSKAQIRDMMENKYNVASTAMDNVIAYGEGVGAVKLKTPSDLFAFMGIHGGLISLVAAKNIKSVAELKGHMLGVDALTTGYSFVLLSVLEKAGMKMNTDYKIKSIGGSPQRLAALQKGEIEGALLSPPRDLLAKAEGFNIVADAAEQLGGYQGSVYAARRSWAKGHEKEILAMVRAVRDAHDVIFKDRAGSIDIMMKRAKKLKKDQANQIYDAMTKNAGGLNRDASINLAGVRNVLALRAKYGMPKHKISETKYVDLSYYKKASVR